MKKAAKKEIPKKDGKPMFGGKGKMPMGGKEKMPSKKKGSSYEDTPV